MRPYVCYITISLHSFLSLYIEMVICKLCFSDESLTIKEFILKVGDYICGWQA